MNKDPMDWAAWGCVAMVAVLFLLAVAFGVAVVSVVFALAERI